MDARAWWQWARVGSWYTGPACKYAAEPVCAVRKLYLKVVCEHMRVGCTAASHMQQTEGAAEVLVALEPGLGSR
jgi:hypothetical protein